MALPSPAARRARVIHRYLGFFLAGIMGVYALSGIALIFRDTDYLKKSEQLKRTVAADLDAVALGKAIEVRRLRFDREEGDVAYFKDGTYDRATGEAVWTKKSLPIALAKMTHLHKAKSGDPLFVLNIAFGLGLLTFVVTAFWMYMPGGTVLRKGLYFAAAGAVLTLALLWAA